MNNKCNSTLLSKTSFLTLILSLTSATWANEPEAEFIRNQQRQDQLEKQLVPELDVHLDDIGVTTSEPAFKLGQDESPCVVIHEIRLVGEQSDKFTFVVPEVIKQSGFKAGMCLGSQGINYLERLAQNAVIRAGYITSQIIIKPQDLNTGYLTLTVIPGKTGHLRYEETSRSLNSVGAVSGFSNKFPLQHNKVLNLRDLEQGLENLRRLPSVEADIQIEPSTEEGYSDIVVNWKQSQPIRVGFGIDDSGSKTTGKYQGTASLSLDNPLGLSDLFYVSYSRDLGHKASYTDAEGVTTDSGTRGYSLHYSVPAGRWLFAWNHNGYRYHEATEGFNLNYDYNGKSYNSNISASRVLYRNGRHKTTASAKLWTQQVYRYVNEFEIDVHRRRTAGWAFDLQHRAQLGRFGIDAGLGYKRGTGLRQSMKAPEEFNTEDGSIPGASRMKIITANLGIGVPFRMGKQLLTLESDLHAQWNKTPLVPQDKLSIGGRYTVRGFDGDNNLAGERGWYWKNNLNWHFLPTHQLYLGLDSGHVSGRSTEELPKQRLVGSVLGLKGSQKIGGVIQYDVFAGKPLRKPDYFKSDSITYGFNLQYHF